MSRLGALGRPNLPLVLTGLLSLAFLLGGSGCDSTAKFLIKNIKFDRLQILSVFPAEITASGFRRVCKGNAGAMEISINFISSQRETSGSTTDEDLDRSIRPGDSIDNKKVIQGESVTKDILDVAVTCIDPYPDPDITTAKQCNGVANPTAQVDQLVYVPLTEKRSKPISVALLIDQSGSMNGLVNPADRLEDSFGSFTLPNDFSAFASDAERSRIAEAGGFIRSLNADDSLIVYTFNGEGVKVACDVPDVQNELERARECYGTRKDLFTDGLSKAGGTERGRTNLWEAAAIAWDFLKENGGDTRHLVIVTDSPDTCYAPSEHFRACRSVCSSVSFTTFKQKVAAEYDQAGIHVSFIQFQAVGYRKQDPRQWEIACETGGQYLFLNSEDLSKAQVELVLPLREAFDKIRFSLAGSWRILVKMPAVGSDAALPQGLPPGTLYGLEGTVRLKKSIFKSASQVTSFSFGSPSNEITLPANSDNRLPFRKSCSDDNQCSGAAECADACHDETAICGLTVLPDGATCGGGLCCQGKCDNVQTCPDICNP